MDCNRNLKGIGIEPTNYNISDKMHMIFGKTVNYRSDCLFQLLRKYFVSQCCVKTGNE